MPRIGSHQSHSPGRRPQRPRTSQRVMSTTIRQLEYLIAVAEHHSFTRAAAALYVSQPTLSQQLMKLEDSLQTQLLERTRREVRLTEAGRLYAAHAVRALRELREGSRALDELEELKRGELRLAMVPPASILIGPALARFASAYPGIELILIEEDQESILNALIDKDVDLGIGFKPSGVEIDPAQHAIQETVLWCQEIRYLVGDAHPDHGRTRPLTLAELADRRLVLLSQAYALRRFVDAYCLKQAVRLKISLEVTSLAMLLEVVGSGVLGTFSIEGFARDRWGIAAVPVTPALGRTQITLLCRHDRYESMSCRVFCEILRQTTKETSAQSR